MIWPTKFARIAELIGEEAAWKVVNARGGIRLFIPINASDSLLAELIGPEAAQRLAAVYGGEAIEIPRLVAHARRQRDAEMAEMARNGVSQAVLARRYNLTERAVRNVLARWRLDRPAHGLQTELFE